MSRWSGWGITRKTTNEKKEEGLKMKVTSEKEGGAGKKRERGTFCP